MKLKEIVIYSIIIGLLGLGIYRLLPKENKKNADFAPVVEFTDATVIKDAKEINSINTFGMVNSWDGDKNVLLVEDANGIKSEFTIDPVSTKVSVVRSQNIYNAPELYVLSKSLQPMHWNHAFCKSDSISLFVNKTSGEVEWIVNTGKRMCGFKEGFL